MKHLKNYQSFINEGAYLNDKGQAVLSWENDPNNPDEVLKSANATVTTKGRHIIQGVEFQGDTPQFNRQARNYGWPIFFGLSIEDYAGKVDDPARFRDTMTQLKAANIENIEASLPRFIKKSFDHLRINQDFRPDYIVTIGSTKGLVGHLAKAANQLFPKADPINLDKVKYLNAGDAIDWEELKAQTGRQKSGAKSLQTFKYTILSYVDKLNLDKEFRKMIMDTQDVDDLRKLITASGRYISPETQIQWLDAIDGETMTPFVVRTSGRNFGGFKQFFKTKYAYDDQEFIEAVLNCIQSGKKMLIIDDNKNTGDDIKDIKKNIIDILKNSGLTEMQRNKALTQFGFYVLYKMDASNSWEFSTKTGEKGNSKKTASSVEDINRFRKSKGWNNPA